MLTGHERAIDRIYGHAGGARGADPAAVLADSHRGYLNFGLWDPGITGYAAAAERLVERLGELLALGPGARLVDAACGRGSQDLCLLRRFGALAIDAVDVTAANVALARAQAAAWTGPGEVRFHHASATRLPFPDRQFTHAVCVEAAHHFDTREAFLREAGRVLVPGGRIALADIVLAHPLRTPTERALVGAACALWRIPAANRVTLDGYRAAFARAGRGGVAQRGRLREQQRVAEAADAHVLVGEDADGAHLDLVAAPAITQAFEFSGRLVGVHLAGDDAQFQAAQFGADGDRLERLLGQAFEFRVGGGRAFDLCLEIGENELSVFLRLAIAAAGGDVGLAARGVEVVRLERGLSPGGCKLRRPCRGVGVDLLVAAAEEFERALPFAPIDRDHGAPQRGGSVVPEGAA